MNSSAKVLSKQKRLLPKEFYEYIYEVIIIDNVELNREKIDGKMVIALCNIEKTVVIMFMLTK